jgi:proline iminopeptidase
MKTLATAHGPSVGHARAPGPKRPRLPGDELLPAARAEATHRIRIEAPAAHVWPWLVQMGRRRAGWYSYDLLDNGGEPSAERIVPELQALEVGDVLPIKGAGDDGFTVLAIDPPRALVLGDPSLLPGHAPEQAPKVRATWAFALEPAAGGATELFARVRVAYEPSGAVTVLAPLVRAVHWLMEQKQLRMIKRRVEAEGRPPGLGAKLRALVGAGDRIAGLTAPFVFLGLAANVLWPSVFRTGLGPVGLAVGAALLVVGVPLWLTSAMQLLVLVPKGRLITGGPFALVLHPVYTSVALLVLPGLGLLLGSWLGVLLGGVLYAAARRFERSEERELATRFPDEYAAYRKRVLLPWL